MPIKIFTVRVTCRRCGKDFEYDQPGSLIGRPRWYCDTCRPVTKKTKPRYEIVRIQEVKLEDE